LESGWRVGETEEHYGRLEQSFWSEEGGFPFISFFDSNVVISPLNIDFCKECAASKLLNDLGN